MALRVVLYAEGAGELAAEWARPAPGQPLLEEHQGPAHVLCARSIASSRGVDPRAIRFEQGLTKRGRIARGSELLRRKVLLQLLAWPRHEMQPQLVVVLVDQDGESTRRETMSGWVAELMQGRPPAVIGVARQEFESWLVTDRSCVQQVLGRSFSMDAHPEDLDPRVAKERLDQAIHAAERAAEGRDVRRAICAGCDLEVLRFGSRSFQRFLDDLKNAPIP